MKFKDVGNNRIVCMDLCDLDHGIHEDQEVQVGIIYKTMDGYSRFIPTLSTMSARHLKLAYRKLSDLNRRVSDVQRKQESK